MNFLKLYFYVYAKKIVLNTDNAVFLTFYAKNGEKYNEIQKYTFCF